MGKKRNVASPFYALLVAFVLLVAASFIVIATSAGADEDTNSSTDTMLSNANDTGTPTLLRNGGTRAAGDTADNPLEVDSWEALKQAAKDGKKFVKITKSFDTIVTKKDDQGNPIQATDEQGIPLVDANNNPIYETVNDPDSVEIESDMTITADSAVTIKRFIPGSSSGVGPMFRVKGGTLTLTKNLTFDGNSNLEPLEPRASLFRWKMEAVSFLVKKAKTALPSKTIKLVNQLQE